MKLLTFTLTLLTLWCCCDAGSFIPIVSREQKVVGEDKAKEYRYAFESARSYSNRWATAWRCMWQWSSAHNLPGTSGQPQTSTSDKCLANGIYQEEQGIIKNADNPGYETQLAEGQYQYVSPEGELIQVKYTADENGFRPVGAHIPTPPPIPKEIQALLAHLATKKPDPEDNPYEGEDLSFLAPPPPGKKAPKA